MLYKFGTLLSEVQSPVPTLSNTSSKLLEDKES